MAIKRKNPSGRSAADILTKARIQLYMEKPFFGHLALQMPFIPSKTAGVGTTCVDNKGRLYYNPEWVESFTIPDAIFEVAHEVMHLVQRCSDRFPMGGDHATWNKAADIVVDTILEESGLRPSEVSKKNITSDIKKRFKDKTTEQVYYALLKECKGNNGGGTQPPDSGKKDDPDEPTGNPNHSRRQTMYFWCSCRIKARSRNIRKMETAHCCGSTTR